MKKLLSLLLLGIATIFLISCSKQNTLDGEYYNQYDYLVLEIKGNQGTYHENRNHPITNVDSQNKTFGFSASGREYVATYDIKKDGTLTFDTGNFLTGGNKQTVYKKDSEAYKKNIKK